MISAKIEDFKIALRDLSEICRAASFVFLVPIIFTLYYAGDYGYSLISLTARMSAFIIPTIILYLFHFVLKRIKSDREARTRHIMITVSLAWI
ncbi:MAG: hypothetical protein DRO90_02890, partial [Candidatus Altiarchaeales archaeon]